MGDSADARLRFAVCTKSGILVDQHFGHAEMLSIYEYEGGAIQKVEVRPVRPYCSGADECDADGRIQGILDALADCVCVICMRIGPDPTDRLVSRGIGVVIACDLIETAIKEAAKQYAAS